MKKTVVCKKEPFAARAAAFLREQLPALRMLLTFLAGFALANATLFSAIAPFGAAYAAAVPKRRTTAATAGAVLGYALASASVGNMKYIAALLLVNVARRLLPEPKTVTAAGLVTAGIAAVSTLLPSALLAILAGGSPYLILLAVAETVLAGAAAFFLRRTGEALTSRRSLGLLRPNETAALLLAFGLFAAGASAVEIAGFSPGRFLVTLVLLTAAWFGKEGAGAVYGLCGGVAVTLGNTALSFYLAAWGFGGLLGGVFAAVGRIVSALGFLFVATLSALAAPADGTQFTIFWETAAACAVFAALPTRWLDLLRPYITRHAEEVDGERASTVFRLQYAGESLRHIGDAVGKVARTLDAPGNDDAKLVDNVAREVCAACDRQGVCWGARYDATNGAFLELLGQLRKEPPPAFEQYPRALLEECRRPKTVASALNGGRLAMRRELGAKAQLASAQSVVASQFEGLGGLLTELAARFERVEEHDPKSTALLRDWLRKHGAEPTAVSVSTDADGRCRAEVCVGLAARRRLDLAALADYAAHICDVRMELADVSETASHQKLLFLQRAVHRVDYGVCQIPRDGNRLCGDSCDYFTGEDGSAFALLSDGMGTGGRAAVDSAMTCSLLGRLLSAGFPLESALNLVNAALLVKSGDESLATLDMARVNLFDGRAELVKCGAAPTFIRRGGKVGAIAATSLPLGILHGVASERRAFGLADGDILVQVSDGVITGETAWLETLLALWHGSAAELSETLATHAKEVRGNEHGDDVTVVVMILRGERG